jgi:hypothetical protein
MNKIILIVLLLLFFQVNPTLADYVFDWSGVCSNSCGKGTESGTRYYQSCTTDKDSGKTCSPLSSPTNVSRSCLGASCSGKSMFYQGIASAITLSINKSNYSPSENINVSSNLSVLACANDTYPVLNATVSTSGSSATIFNSYYHGTGEYFNQSTGTFWDYLTTTYVYSASANLTAPASGGNYTVWTNFMSGSIPYTVTASTPTPCVPDCSCNSSTCVGSTCPDGCGGDCAGTLPGTCGPSDAYCDGVPYDDSCGNSTCTGTKECLDYCNTSPGGYYCTGSTGSGNPGLTLNWLYDWCSAYCSSGSCNCTWFYNSCDPDSTPCGNEYCDASDPDCEYCNGSDVWTKDQGDQTTCTGTAGGCSSYLDECNHALKETCEVGYICKETGTCTADCVPKASTWTEV